MLTSRNVTTPLAQVSPSNRRVCGKDGHRNSPVTGRQIVRPFGHHIVTVEPLVFDSLIPQELGQAPCCCDGTAFAALVLIQGFAHGAGLADELKQLLMAQVHALQQDQTVDTKNSPTQLMLQCGCAQHFGDARLWLWGYTLVAHVLAFLRNTWTPQM